MTPEEVLEELNTRRHRSYTGWHIQVEPDGYWVFSSGEYYESLEPFEGYAVARTYRVAGGPGGLRDVPPSLDESPGWRVPRPAAAPDPPATEPRP